MFKKGEGTVAQGQGVLRSGIRQEFRLFQGNLAPPKVLATSATLILAEFVPAPSVTPILPNASIACCTRWEAIEQSPLWQAPL